MQSLSKIMKYGGTACVLYYLQHAQSIDNQVAGLVVNYITNMPQNEICMAERLYAQLNRHGYKLPTLGAYLKIVKAKAKVKCKL